MKDKQIFNLTNAVYSRTRAICQRDLLLRSSSKSNASKRSSCSSKSDNSKTEAIEEKAKLVNLLAKQSFLIKQQMQIAENEGEKLKKK